MWAVAGSIIVAVIGFIGNVITSRITSRATYSKITAELEKHNAVQDTKLDELTREVREHNNFARRMPVVEEQISRIKEDIKELKK